MIDIVEGIAGASIKKRKKFMRMMKDVYEDMFDLIFTREVSIIDRDIVNILQLQEN